MGMYFTGKSTRPSNDFTRYIRKEELANFIPRTGGKLEGDIEMDGHNIVGLPSINPDQDPSSAVNKSYVDHVVKPYTSAIHDLQLTKQKNDNEINVLMAANRASAVKISESKNEINVLKDEVKTLTDEIKILSKDKSEKKWFSFKLVEYKGYELCKELDSNSQIHVEMWVLCLNRAWYSINSYDCMSCPIAPKLTEKLRIDLDPLSKMGFRMNFVIENSCLSIYVYQIPVQFTGDAKILVTIFSSTGEFSIAKEVPLRLTRNDIAKTIDRHPPEFDELDGT
jgi:hypothetical protein